MIAWLFNLDAERELAAPRSYQPRRAIADVVAKLRPVLGSLLAPGDGIVLPDDPPGRFRGFRGRAWCPTPSAQRRLREVGAELSPAPPVEVLRAVNDRAFSAALGQTLPGACFVRDERELQEAVASFPAGRRLLLKRAFSFAGKGRRPVAAGTLDEGALAWARASFKSGGVQVEPFVERLLDLGLHGFLAADGTVTFGVPTVQQIAKDGAWRGSTRAEPGLLDAGEEASLKAEGARVAQALRAAGYHGPFGIDAFRYREAGAVIFNPRTEINARYSMGWALAMQDRRPDRG
ncbi:MAG: hypothetical protein R3B72_42300 [Polyangiaceae bacterium]